LNATAGTGEINIESVPEMKRSMISFSIVDNFLSTNRLKMKNNVKGNNRPTAICKMAFEKKIPNKNRNALVLIMNIKNPAFSFFSIFIIVIFLLS
jgi:hypothetical protein